MLKNNFLVFFLCFFCKITFAMTINEAVEKTLSESNESKKLQADYSSYTAGQVLGFEKLLLPSVGYKLNKITTTPLNLNDTKTQEGSFFISYDVSNLYKGSFLFSSNVAGLNSKKSLNKEEVSKLTISAIEIFLNVFEAQKSVELLEKSLNVNLKMLERAKERYNYGSSRKTSVLLLESQVEEIAANLELSKNNLEIAKVKFAKIIGIAPENLQEPNEETITFKTFEDFISQVKKENNSLKASESAKNSAKYNLAYESSQFLPDISITLEKYKTQNLTLDTKDEGKRIIISAKLYFYNPGVFGSVAKSGYEYRSAKEQNFVDQKSITIEAQDLWAKNDYYKTAVTSKQRLVDTRKKLVSEYAHDYSYGRIELTDVLEEERKLTESELELLKLKIQKLLNIYKIKSLAGVKIL